MNFQCLIILQTPVFRRNSEHSDQPWAWLYIWKCQKHSLSCGPCHICYEFMFTGWKKENHIVIQMHINHLAESLSNMSLLLWYFSPKSWTELTVSFNTHSSAYIIILKNPDGQFVSLFITIKQFFFSNAMQIPLGLTKINTPASPMVCNHIWQSDHPSCSSVYIYNNYLLLFIRVPNYEMQELSH